MNLNKIDVLENNYIFNFAERNSSREVFEIFLLMTRLKMEGVNEGTKSCLL